jgi:hypothetical protein
MLAGRAGDISCVISVRPSAWSTVSVVHADMSPPRNHVIAFLAGVLRPESVTVTGIGPHTSIWDIVPFVCNDTTRRVSFRGTGEDTAGIVLGLQTQTNLAVVEHIKVPVVVWIHMYMKALDMLMVARHYYEEGLEIRILSLMAKCEIEHGGMTINPGLTTTLKPFKDDAILDKVPVGSLRVLYATYLVHNDWKIFTAPGAPAGGDEEWRMLEQIRTFVSHILMRILDADSSDAGIIDLYQLQTDGPFAPYTPLGFYKQMQFYIPTQYNDRVYNALLPIFNA